MKYDPMAVSLRIASCWVVGLGLCLAPLISMAAVPLKLPVQGVVRDNAGAPVAEDVFSARFALYDSPAAILPIWVEHWPPEGVDCALLPNACLVVQGGTFQVELGHYTPLDTSIFATGDTLWMGLAVETDPELPRRPLGSSPYAIHAGSAAGLACSGCVTEDMLSLETREALRDQAIAAVQTLGYVDAAGAIAAVDDAGYVTADGAVSAVETAGYVTADGAVSAVETAGYVTADGAVEAVQTLGYVDAAGAVAVVDDAGYVKADGAVSAVETAGYLKADGAVSAVEAGDLNVAGVVQIAGGVVVGPGPLPCDEAHAGALQFDPNTQRLAFCTGTQLLQLRGCSTDCAGAIDVACGEALTTGCGDPCEGVGAGLNTVQCLSAVNTTPCGVDVVDGCGNTCAQVGNALESAQCPAAEAVICGEVITDACGNACGGTGLGFAEAQCSDPAQTPCGQSTTDTCANDCGVPGTGLSLGTCPLADSVTCNEAIADACGNPCGTAGSQCPEGKTCADAGCVGLGEAANIPGVDCKDIKTQVGSSEDGQYWIDPDGPGGQGAFQVFCDMTADGGGWTLYTKWTHGTNHVLHTPGDDVGSCGFEDAYSDFDSECGLPEAWERFGHPAEVRYVMQDAAAGRGDFDFDYKRGADSFIVGTGNWMPNGSFTALMDNCVSGVGTQPTTDSCDGCGAWCTDKSTPGSAGNWDVRACDAFKDANCDRWGFGGPGTNRPATSMLFVR